MRAAPGALHTGPHVPQESIQTLSGSPRGPLWHQPRERCGQWVAVSRAEAENAVRSLDKKTRCKMQRPDLRQRKGAWRGRQGVGREAWGLVQGKGRKQGSLSLWDESFLQNTLFIRNQKVFKGQMSSVVLKLKVQTNLRARKESSSNQAPGLLLLDKTGVLTLWGPSTPSGSFWGSSASCKVSGQWVARMLLPITNQARSKTGSQLRFIGGSLGWGT